MSEVSHIVLARFSRPDGISADICERERQASAALKQGKDHFRARTLSLADDASGAAADLVEGWLTQEMAIEVLAIGIARSMAERSEDQAYLDRCNAEFSNRSERALIEKEFAFRSWWPGIRNIERPN